MLAAEPELAYALTVDRHLGGDQRPLDAQREWIARFGDLLHDAAAADPRAAQAPSFLAPSLISSVRFQIARLVLDGEAADLFRLLPGTSEALLAFYFEPGYRRGVARSAGAADGGS